MRLREGAFHFEMHPSIVERFLCVLLFSFPMRPIDLVKRRKHFDLLLISPCVYISTSPFARSCVYEHKVFCSSLSTANGMPFHRWALYVLCPLWTLLFLLAYRQAECSTCKKKVCIISCIISVCFFVITVLFSFLFLFYFLDW